MILFPSDRWTTWLLACQISFDLEVFSLAVLCCKVGTKVVLKHCFRNDKLPCLKQRIFFILNRNSAILVLFKRWYSRLYSLQFWDWFGVVCLSVHCPEMELSSQFGLKAAMFYLSLWLRYWPDWPQTSCVALVITCRTRMWVKIMFLWKWEFWLILPNDNLSIKA